MDMWIKLTLYPQYPQAQQQQKTLLFFDEFGLTNGVHFLKCILNLCPNFFGMYINVLQDTGITLRICVQCKYSVLVKSANDAHRDRML